MDDSVSQGLKVNLGCGPIQPRGWINVDGSNRAWLAAKLPWWDRLLTRLGAIPPTEFGPQVTVHNLYKPLPFRANSIACIYAGELWEHFEYPDAVRLTGECFRVLVPGGILRVRVPDGPEFWREYLDLYDREISKPTGQRSARILRDHVTLYFREICTRRKILGSMGHTHKWQFDEVQLVELFEATGFVSVARMPYQQSRIPDIESVEKANFLIVEGVKPGERVADQHGK